jgi:hypothetical protein
MGRTTVKRLAWALLVPTLLSSGLSACSQGKRPTFTALPTGAATAPATPVAVPANGDSKVSVTGEITFDTTVDFQCSFAPDDFFIRGVAANVDGVPVYVSINVEFFRGPNRYARRTQVLIRRINENGSFYASWYENGASLTVLPKGKGGDLDTVTVQPEAGTQSTGPIRIGGHFSCLAPPTAGKG